MSFDTERDSPRRQPADAGVRDHDLRSANKMVVRRRDVALEHVDVRRDAPDVQLTCSTFDLRALIPYHQTAPNSTNRNHRFNKGTGLRTKASD